jgi:hypothetical protein
VNRSKSTGVISALINGNTYSQKKVRRPPLPLSDSDSETQSGTSDRKPNYFSSYSEYLPNYSHRKTKECDSLRESLVGKLEYQRRDRGEIQAQRKPRDTRSENTRDRRDRKIETSNHKRNSSVRKSREPYLFHNLSYK